MRRSNIFASLALVGLGCGGGASDAVTPEVVATIQVTSESPTINVREQRTLAVQFRDDAGRQLIGVTGVTWTSSDPGTVSVDGSGLVQGVKAGGPVTITVAQGGVTGSVSLSVVPTVRLQPATALLEVGSAVTLVVNTVDFFGATIGTVTASSWSSSNTNVATVDANGRVGGVATGDVTITAVAAGAQQSAQLEVGVTTPFDGVWTGTPFPNPGLGFGTVATLTVKFGAVRAFDLAISWTFTTTCTGQANAIGKSPIVANAFTFPSPYGAAMPGQFTDANNGSMSFTTLGIPPSFFPCAPTNVSVLVAVPGRTFALTK